MSEPIAFGQHRVELRKTGYEKYVKVVVIKPEELENTQLENVTLKKDPNYKEQQVAVTQVTPTTQNVSGSQSTQSALITPTASSVSGNRTFTVKGVTFEMVAVKGGTFTMGSNDYYADYDEKPAHSVTLSDYYIGKFEVTQELWQAVMGNNPSRFKGNNRPVEKVSWDDVQEFITKLNQKTGASFRLPTEAEWEYAARGGNKSNGYIYSGSNNINNVAWYSNTTGQEGTRPVGTKSPNELGIYDMTGSIWEWCQDWHGNYISGSQTNPTGPSNGSVRVLRGGSWDNGAGDCRVLNRTYSGPGYRQSTFGFRLVLVP
ncbi:MAG: formylglycine-generating enzyme family protein [Bacteroidales bacterium]|nr:formylglycine-generating enzyme family protein [Bacteroidales bacterium]